MNTIIITLMSVGDRYTALDLAALVSTLRTSDPQVYFLISTKKPITINLN